MKTNHIDEIRLAEIADGFEISGQESEHIRECSLCKSEIESFKEVSAQFSQSLEKLDIPEDLETHILKGLDIDTEAALFKKIDNNVYIWSSTFTVLVLSLLFYFFPMNIEFRSFINSFMPQELSFLSGFKSYIFQTLLALVLLLAIEKLLKFKKFKVF